MKPVSRYHHQQEKGVRANQQPEKTGGVRVGGGVKMDEFKLWR